MLKRFRMLLIPLVVMLVMAVPFTDAVTIELVKKETMIAYFPLHDADSHFRIIYTHSVHQSEVIEKYQVMKDGTIRQTELEYEDTAVGMPSNAGDGETFLMKDGKYFIKNMKRDFPWIDLSTGQVYANHRLAVRNHIRSFNEIAEPGTVVRIRKRKLSLWQQWKGVNIVGR